MLCLCCHSSSTPALSTQKKGTEIIFLLTVSWKEPELGKTLYHCICYLSYLDTHYWISSSNDLCLWQLIIIVSGPAEECWQWTNNGLKLPLSIQTWFSDCSAVSASYLVNLYIYAFMLYMYMYIFNYKIYNFTAKFRIGSLPVPLYSHFSTIPIPTIFECLQMITAFMFSFPLRRGRRQCKYLVKF